MQSKPSLGANASILPWTYDLFNSFGTNIRCKNQGTASFYPLPAVIFSSPKPQASWNLSLPESTNPTPLRPCDLETSAVAWQRRIDPRGGFNMFQISNCISNSMNISIKCEIYNLVEYIF